jgi:hypothetical protein
MFVVVFIRCLKLQTSKKIVHSVQVCYEFVLNYNFLSFLNTCAKCHLYLFRGSAALHINNFYINYFLIPNDMHLMHYEINLRRFDSNCFRFF